MRSKNSDARSIQERSYHKRMQRFGKMLDAPISYVNIIVTNFDCSGQPVAEIVPWPVLLPKDFATQLHDNCFQ